MLSCPECQAEISDAAGRCPQCGHSCVDAPVWKVAFKTPEGLRKHFESHLVHHGLVVPRPESAEPHTLVRLRLVLPDASGDLWLTGKVVGTMEQPPGAKAPYAVQLELLDLDADRKETLRRVAGAAAAAASPPQAAESPPQAEEEPSAPREAATPIREDPAPERVPPVGADRERREADALVDALIQPRSLPVPEPTARAEASAPPEPAPSRAHLPEELAAELTEFTLQFVRAVTKSSYYTADHQEAGKAKLGLFAAFTTLVANRPEVTFYARTAGEKCSILVYGIFDEPTDLAQAMLKGTSELYIPKLSHYFEANELVSISFKAGLSEEEFHRFVDLLANPASVARGDDNGIARWLAENRIHAISVVVAEDRIASRDLSWRVEMALTRLKKDLSVIPLYEHLSNEDLARIRLQVFRDVVRPLRQVDLIRELLENCDRIIEEVAEFSEDQLAEIEGQVLSSVPESSLPMLLTGLVDDIAKAKERGEEQRDRLLRLTRRVALHLRPEQAKKLERAFRVLLTEEVLGFDDLPTFLQRKIILERDADAFLDLEERTLGRFDREPCAERYQAFLDFFESIFPELLARADPSSTLAIVERVSGHRTAHAPFERRPELAAAWLERVIHSSLAEVLVRELPRADKLKRESLLELSQRLGDETVPILFKALAASENAATRDAITEVLTKQELASRALVRRELEGEDLPTSYLLELLRILGRVGGSDCADLVKRALAHADPAVRIEALDAAAALDPAFGEERALSALSDADPKVRTTALKGLFERSSTAPALFAFCARILRDLDAANEPMARMICSRLGAYEQGEARGPCVALLRAALGEREERGGRLWSSLKRAVSGEPKHASVRVAACQALGRMRAVEATDVLEVLSRSAAPALKRAAQQALERIRSS